MTAFFFDTDSELNWKEAKELGLTNVIRMPYTICNEERFADLGESYDPKAFFDLVKAGNVPVTSALNMEDYRNYFEPFFKKGEDIFYVSFGSSMSGTFKYMDIAVAELQKEYPNVKFTRYDTNAISMATGIAVCEAAKLFNAGKSVEEICAFLDVLVPRINAYVVADDLQHLKRGGRITAVKAAIGGLLKIKPVIKLTTAGKLSPFASVPGRNKALATITDEVIRDIRDTDKYPIVVMSADCRADADRVINKLKTALPNVEIWDYDVGPVIGTHCGPGTVGICFVGDARPTLNA